MQNDDGRNEHTPEVPQALLRVLSPMEWHFMDSVEDTQNRFQQLVGIQVLFQT